jgi:hypothetical protein
MPVSAEERQQILSLLAEGKINAGEAVRLLEAVARGRDAPAARAAARARADRLCVRVTDRATGATRVNLSLPLSVARALARILPPAELARFGQLDLNLDPDLDLDRIQEALERGEAGTVLEIDDDGAGHRVRVWTE